METKAESNGPQDANAKPARYRFRLFVAGGGPNSARAKGALGEICADLVEGQYHVEIVDVLEDFRYAVQEGIALTPALIVEGPQHRTVIFGNLTDKRRVLAAIEKMLPQ